MDTRANTLPMIFLGSLLIFSVGAVAQSTAAPSPVTGKDADNTSTNVRDRGNAMTPIDQSNSKADIQVAAAVRSAIVADHSLSTKAHNVKLVANNGAVILRGPVDSDAEKTKVEQIAKGIAGVTSVDNNLDVKTTNH
jgi:hyperosmotically inducible periplasmic protein